MASVSSITTSSASSTLGMSGKGIGGLATGLDTDSLVAALTSGTQSKIAKQGQQKQLLNWKMTAYRTMSAALNAFQSKSLKSTSATTNITKNDFFSTYKATSSSSKVSVSTTSGSTVGNFTINSVTQLAEAEKYTSVSKLSGTLGFDLSEINGGRVTADMFTGQTLKLDVDGFTTKTIKLDDLNGAIKGDGTFDEGVFESTLQKLVNDAYKSSSVVSVDVSNGKVTFDSNSASIWVNTDNKMLDLNAGDTNRINTGKTVGELFGDQVSGNTFTFTINGIDISVNKSDTIDTLMSRVTNSGADVRMDYDIYNDVFTLTSKKTGADSAISISDKYGNLMNGIFGAQGGSGISTNYLTTGTSFTSLNANTIDSMTDAERISLGNSLKYMTFDMTVNGVTKTVRIDTTLGINSQKLEAGTFTSEDVYNAINKGIQTAFNYGTNVEFSAGEDGKTVIGSSTGEAFDIGANGTLAKLLGFGDGSSSVNAGNIVYDYGYSRTVDSNPGYIDPATLGLTQDNPTTSFDMTINGVTKTITVSLDERDPLTDEEKAQAAADPDKKFYSELSGDVFVARLNSSVAEAFGGDAVTFDASYTYDYETFTDIEGFEGTTFVFDENDLENSGVYKNGQLLGNITKDLGNGMYALDKGNGNLTIVDKDGNLLDANGKQIPKSVTGMHLTLNTSDSGNVASKSVVLGAGFETLGFNANASNSAPGSGIKLSELGLTSGGSITINGKDVTYTADTTLQDLISKINNTSGIGAVAGIKDGKLYIDSTGGDINVSDSGDLLKNVFGIGSGNYESKTVTDNQRYTAGKNAILDIDGRTFEWSSNNVSYNGVNLTLNDTSSEKITIGVQSDPDDVVSRIKDWMEDYNALVYTLNSAINEGKKSDYAPLTDEQKAEMTEDQIKTWEAEAKKGILRNDQTLRQILADMRSSFYEKVEAAGISLYDIGIVTKSGLSDSNEAGQLEFDKNVDGGGEERLRQMLINEPDKVRMLFTDENGIGARLNTIITRAASTSSVDRGTLVRIAGTEQLTGDNTSQLGNKIDAIDKYITALKSRLESEYNRYWKKFSALETSVQKMNMQSSWLTSA